MSKHNNGFFYHFTAHRFASQILRDGLTKGIVVDVDKLNMLLFKKGFQWITKSKKFKQSWCQFSTLAYNRNEVRFTLKFDETEQNNLINWLDLCRDEPSEMKDILNLYGDPENWYLYKGSVAPGAIAEIDFNPQYIKGRAKNDEFKNTNKGNCQS